MKERYFVATLSHTNPELEAVYWFENKQEAAQEAQRQRDFYTKEKIIFAKVLNIPKIQFISKISESDSPKGV